MPKHKIKVHTKFNGVTISLSMWTDYLNDLAIIQQDDLYQPYHITQIVPGIPSSITLNHSHHSQSVSYPESMTFHFLRSLDLAVMSTPITALHSFPFSCSVILVNSLCRLRHRSNSDRGPALGSMNLHTVNKGYFRFCTRKSNKGDER